MIPKKLVAKKRRAEVAPSGCYPWRDPTAHWPPAQSAARARTKGSTLRITDRGITTSDGGAMSKCATCEALQKALIEMARRQVEDEQKAMARAIRWVSESCMGEAWTPEHRESLRKVRELADRIESGEVEIP